MRSGTSNVINVWPSSSDHKAIELPVGENLQRLKFMVGNLHVGTSRLEVLRFIIREKMGMKNFRRLPKALKRGLIVSTVAIHGGKLVLERRQIMPSPLLLFVRESGFPNMRATLLNTGWVTDGRLAFKPTEKIVAKLNKLKAFTSMKADVPFPTMTSLIGAYKPSLDIGLEKVDNPDGLTDHMGCKHHYTCYRRGLTWQGAFVDLVNEQYPDARTFLCFETVLVWTVAGEIVAVCAGRT